jgi:hypothetical protein
MLLRSPPPGTVVHVAYARAGVAQQADLTLRSQLDGR